MSRQRSNDIILPERRETDMPIVEQGFDREKHVYRNDDLSELLRRAVQFFNGTPVLQLPLKEKFTGAGVYALYYRGKEGLYAPYGDIINAYAYNEPIYIGKAEPAGKRQSRSLAGDVGTKLYDRLLEHVRSIRAGKGLQIKDFCCRFVICEGDTATMIPAFEAALTAKFRPLWNSFVDGFGNHAPGKGRDNGMRSQWDTIHPGRKFAERLPKNLDSVAMIKRRVTDFFVSRAPHYS